MKKYLMAALLFVSLFVKSQTAPQRLFPILFEDANGDRDTVYIGYDPSAGSSSEFDEEFEDYLWIDTSKFSVVVNREICYSPYTGNWNIDSAKKTEISGTYYFGNTIDFIKGQMPITMFWDVSFLYSSSLPYPDLSPYPNGVIYVYCGAGEPGYINCPSAFDEDPLSITDMPNPNYKYPISSPHFFDGSGMSPNYNEPEEVLNQFEIAVVPYLKSDLIDHHMIDLNVNFFPLPFDDILNIRCDKRMKKIEIIDMYGEFLISKQLNNFSYTINNLSLIRSGIYIINILIENNIYSKLIIKQ